MPAIADSQAKSDRILMKKLYRIHHFYTMPASGDHDLSNYIDIKSFFPMLSFGCLNVYFTMEVLIMENQLAKGPGNVHESHWACPLHIRDIVSEAGLDLGTLDPELAERLSILNRHSETLCDTYHAILVAKTIFAHHNTANLASAFTEDERRIVTFGMLFSDIGKTGPRHATRELQVCIAEIFGVEDRVDPQMPLRNFVTQFFPADATERLRLLAANNLEPQLPMRTFWDLHSKWTLEILTTENAPKEAIGAAAAHHIIDGVNPEGIVSTDNRFTQQFGANHTFDRAEKLIIVLDKYDAARRRGKRTHDEAIAQLRERIGNSAYHSGDPEFRSLIDTLDSVLHAYEGYVKK